MRVVPPPISAMGRWPARCRCAMNMSCSEVADVQARRRGIEADVERDLLRVQQLPQPLLVGALADEAALLQRVEDCRCGTPRISSLTPLPFCSP